MNKIFKISIISLVLTYSIYASAQDQTSWDNEPAQDQAPPPPPAEEQPLVTTTDDQPADATPYAQSLHEEPGKAYHSVGMRLRWIFVPKWMISMFGVDIQGRNLGKPLVSNLGIGAEYTYRKDNFDITAAIWWAGLDWDGDISFKQKSEPPQSWEVVSSNLSALLFTADFIWSTPIRDWVAITYGVGVGFGIGIGELHRDEATVASGGLDRCPGPNTGDSGCVTPGEFDVVYDKIKVVPWINFLVGARFKPHEHMAIYVDGGFGVGFQMGIRGGYIF
ncbi:MAG: hypothetical protein JXR91_00255 [Deltaproteobacteria bacterium]|nr:hypothetical protein [Deltaproteobacteria bacterium]